MELQELIRQALIEDIGQADITTEATVPATATGVGLVRAKERLVVAGHEAAAEVFRQLGARYTPLQAEGESVEPGTVVARAEGPLRALLTGERTALNLLMHLSGIATHTADVIRAAPGLKITDTRKTVPLLRALERRAVRFGGGANHRFALYDGILIKDNHIVAAGGITAALRAARRGAHHLLRIEVEVQSMAQAEEAVAAGAEVLLLDNMSDAAMAEVIAHLRGRALFEASGNITRERLPGLAALGLDLVSMGGLIHQARWVDLSMKIQVPTSEPTAAGA